MTEPRQAKPTVKFVDDYCQWYELDLSANAKRLLKNGFSAGERTCSPAGNRRNHEGLRVNSG